MEPNKDSEPDMERKNPTREAPANGRWAWKPPSPLRAGLKDLYAGVGTADIETKKGAGKP